MRGVDTDPDVESRLLEGCTVRDLVQRAATTFSVDYTESVASIYQRLCRGIEVRYALMFIDQCVGTDVITLLLWKYWTGGVLLSLGVALSGNMPPG